MPCKWHKEPATGFRGDCVLRALSFYMSNILALDVEHVNARIWQELPGDVRASLSRDSHAGIPSGLLDDTLTRFGLRCILGLQGKRMTVRQVAQRTYQPLLLVIPRHMTFVENRHVRDVWDTRSRTVQEVWAHALHRSSIMRQWDGYDHEE